MALAAFPRSSHRRADATGPARVALAVGAQFARSFDESWSAPGNRRVAEALRARWRTQQ
jgi:hypothetical protein